MILFGGGQPGHASGSFHSHSRKRVFEGTLRGHPRMPALEKQGLASEILSPVAVGDHLLRSSSRTAAVSAGRNTGKDLAMSK